jgi:hypothetical protein
MKKTEETSDYAAHREDYGNLQDQSEKVQHQRPPFAGGGCLKPWNGTVAHEGQSFTESVPSNDLESDLPSTVATMDSSRPPLQPA